MNNQIEGFKKVVDEMIALKSKKAGDYANSWRALGLQGLLYQIARKFSRLWINKDKKEDLNCEMYRDSLIDLAVYSIMAIQLIDENDTNDKIDEVLKGINNKNENTLN